MASKQTNNIGSRTHSPRRGKKTPETAIGEALAHIAVELGRSGEDDGDLERQIELGGIAVTSVPDLIPDDVFKDMQTANTDTREPYGGPTTSKEEGRMLAAELLHKRREENGAFERADQIAYAAAGRAQQHYANQQAELRLAADQAALKAEFEATMAPYEQQSE